ncbi:Tether containing UBX domain for GLUT4, partial [Acropora cervicornis]
MAACKSVVVLCPNARRHTVKVNPTTTILQVLEEVNQRKILDDTLPIRYSGLANNAHLELVVIHSTSTVALQLESGERLVKEFSSSSSVWDVLCHWDTNQDSMHQGKILNSSPEEHKSPVCIYMTQEIKGEKALQNTTLHSLGLTGKRAIIRLIHRLLEEQTLTAKNTETASEEEPKVEDKIVDPVSQLETVNKPVVMSATSSSEGKNQFGLSTETQKDVAMDDVISSKMRSKASDASVQEGAKEPKRARMSPPKPLFSDFKFPEETAGMDLYQREQADSSRREFLATSCDRHPIVFSEEYASSPTLNEGDQLPDSFFEVTVDDIRVMLRDLKNERNQADTAPLMTRAMREVRDEAEMYNYDTVVVRIKFPDRLILQAFFRPMEKDTTPPRKILDQRNSTLFENKLYPASVIYFGSQEKREHFLAARYVDNPSTVLDAEKALVDNGVLSVRSSARPDIGDSLVSSSTVDRDHEPGASSSRADRSVEEPNRIATDRPRHGGASKG